MARDSRRSCKRATRNARRGRRLVARMRPPRRSHPRSYRPETDLSITKFGISLTPLQPSSRLPFGPIVRPPSPASGICTTPLFCFPNVLRSNLLDILQDTSYVFVHRVSRGHRRGALTDRAGCGSCSLRLHFLRGFSAPRLMSTDRVAKFRAATPGHVFATAPLEYVAGFLDALDRVYGQENAERVAKEKF